MLISIIVSGNFHYETCVKASSQLGLGLQESGADVCLFSPSLGVEAEHWLVARFGRDRVVSIPRRGGPRSASLELKRKLLESKSDWILSDDRIDQLQMLQSVRARGDCGTIVYPLAFYGLRALSIHSPNPMWNLGSSTKFRLAPLVPFSLLASRYKGLMASASAVISISRYAENLASTLYGIASAGVVYPPVDTKVYADGATRRGGRPRSGVLVFVGTRMDRDPSTYLPTLRELSDQGLDIHLFGDPSVMSALEARIPGKALVLHPELSDDALADLHSQVKCVYLTPEWEGFGYVGPEALMCGATVVCERSFPWMEITGDSDKIRVIRNPSKLSREIVRTCSSPDSLDTVLTDRLIRELSPRHSARLLMQILSDIQQ